jgi:predicted nucleic-acid-binding protein
MLSVDTNVLVRLLAGDDREQSPIARSLFAAQPIRIAKTVLLETEWVLRSRYGLTQEASVAALVSVLGLPEVEVEDGSAVKQALGLTQHGISFADALHLSSRPPGATFVSFDRNFVRRAKRAGVTEILDATS